MSDLVVRQTDKELRFSQILEAPRAVVFKTFSSPEHLKQWWGPPGCPVDYCEVDFRVGGEWKYSIVTAAGETHWSKAIYRTIEPDCKIVFDDYFLDTNGDIIADLPSKHVEIVFDGEGGQTELTIHIQLQTAAERQQLMDMGFLRGFSTALAQLRDYVKTI